MRRFILALAACLPLCAGAQPPIKSSAEQWPTKPIHALVPFAPGSTIDVLARSVAGPLADALGQPIVIENRGGAGGSIGSAYVVNQAPDGYTILIHASAHSATPAAYPQASYDAARDLRGVAIFGVVPNVTVIAPSKNIKTLQELVAAAKAGRIRTYASAGVGSATHWAAERLRIAASFPGTHVPFKGGPEALTQVASGEVDWMSIGVTSGMPFIRQGRLIPLAVSTAKRSSILPDVPTNEEAGVPNSDYTFWNGILVHSKTPPDIVQRLHEETMKVLAQPAVADKLKPQGLEPMPLKPAEFDALIAREVETNKQIVKAAGLKFN
jgi:tripartite-type tricarboxylate transporter receptor subunit TctC